MNNNYICVFDSGIGGLSTLEELKRQLPNENFFYFGDKKNNPYGEKPQENLEDIVYHISDFLIHQKSAKLIVIACNTATTRCISFLRKSFPDTLFIGTEPAIKLACNSGAKRILVLATSSTTKSERVASLVDDSRKPGQDIVLLPCPGLAEAIEKSDDSEISATINKILQNINPKEFDTVVLGCTHYVLIRETFSSYFPNAEIIDGNRGIAKRTRDVLEKNNLLSTRQNPGTTEYYYT